MADRKSRTAIFNTPKSFSLEEINLAVNEMMGPDTLEVVQVLPDSQVLLQFKRADLAEEVIESGLVRHS